MLRAALAAAAGGSRPAGGLLEVVERDDGVLATGPAGSYLAPPPEWPDCERRAADRLAGRVLDVGAGAGRLALLLQAREIPVTALDVSAGAVGVCRQRGVRDTVHATAGQHAASGRRYDCFALFGNNLGLLGSRARAPVMLRSLAALARPGARIIGLGEDPPDRPGPVTEAYVRRNRAAGRLPGQRRLRSRFQELATGWFDFLWCTAAELEQLADGSGWKLADVHQPGGPRYAATLVLRR
jgi:SAM-dependent methyltransferase